LTTRSYPSRGLSGGASIGTTINEGDVEYVQNVQNRSTATNTTIDGEAAVQIVDGGISIVTTIKAGGLEIVRNGGTANGTIIQDGGSEYVQNGSTANTVIFAGSNSLLKLDSPSGLAGTIIDWHVGDKIDFLNTIATGVNETGNTLTVTYGDHHIASYSLTGKRLNTEFQLQPDGNGGTNNDNSLFARSKSRWGGIRCRRRAKRARRPEYSAWSLRNELYLPNA
jgi:autotransporter passenger strand-loop-strand repeat protein